MARRLFRKVYRKTSVPPTPNAFGAALPLSYPGAPFISQSLSQDLCPTNPECFRGCSTAELPWRCGQKVRRRVLTCQYATLLLCRRKIWHQIFFGATERCHEADPVTFRDRSNPAFLMDITPAWELQDGPGLGIPLRREKKELHAFLGYPNLGDALRFIVFKNTAANRLKIGEFRRHVVMFQSVFQKKQVAQR